MTKILNAPLKLTRKPEGIGGWLNTLIAGFLLLSAPFAYADGWRVEDDGSYSMSYRNISLSHCYPSMDMKAIHPVSVNVEREDSEATITYYMKKGTIVVTLSMKDDLYRISSKLKGLERVPGWFHPLAAGELNGADRFYKQGFGFAGPSGVFHLPEPRLRMEQAILKEDVWAYDSYLFTGFISPEEHTIVFSAFDHKNYLHRSSLYNRQNRFGLIDRHLGDNKVFFESGFALEEVDQGGDEILLPDIYISTGEEAYGTFQMQAKRLAGFNRVELHHPPAYFYCSWYEFQREFTHEILKDMLNGIEETEIDPEFQYIQIDAGYSIHGDWLTARPDLFPGGLEAVADDIRSSGYKAGIWVGPFMAMGNSEIVKNHPDWLLKDLEGNPLIGWERPDESMFILDSSHPEAFEYLRKVFRRLRQMGFTDYKTDFMDWGYQDSRKVKRYAPGKTSAQYFNEVVEMIREEIGTESYWLGCISPYQGMVGYVDAVRLSNDVHPRWTEESTINMFREMYAGQFFNNILWQNDPDVLYLRDYKTELTDEDKYSIALYDGILGGVLNTSCRFHTVPEEFQKLWKFIKPGETHHTAKLPGWTEPDSPLIAVRGYENTSDCAILFVNILEESVERAYELKELSGITEGMLYEWSQLGTHELGKASKVNVQLEPHESLLIYVSEDGNPPGTASRLNELKP